MQQQPNEQQRKWDDMEREVVYILTDPDRHLPIWSVADLGREIEYRDPEAVIRPLVNAGPRPPDQRRLRVRHPRRKPDGAVHRARHLTHARERHAAGSGVALDENRRASADTSTDATQHPRHIRTLSRLAGCKVPQVDWLRCYTRYGGARGRG
jgi:hypothetical protein